MFAWGLWTLTVLLTASGLAAPDAVAGMAHLTGLLGGFALTVAGLMTLLPARSPRRESGSESARVAASVRASRGLAADRAGARRNPSPTRTRAGPDSRASRPRLART